MLRTLQVLESLLSLVRSLRGKISFSVAGNASNVARGTVWASVQAPEASRAEASDLARVSDASGLLRTHNT